MKISMIIALVAFCLQSHAQATREIPPICKCYERHPIIYVIDGVQVSNIGEEANDISMANTDHTSDIESMKTGYYYRLNQIEPISIRTVPTSAISDVAALFTNVCQVQKGDDIQAGGSRPGDMLYVIDGMRIDNR